MKIRILQKASNDLKIELEGEGHTFCNMLQKALLEDEAVEVAGYHKPHPLMTKSIVYIRTEGTRSPQTALHEAAEKLRERSKELREALHKAFQGYNEPPASEN